LENNDNHHIYFKNERKLGLIFEILSYLVLFYPVPQAQIEHLPVIVHKEKMKM